MPKQKQKLKIPEGWKLTDMESISRVVAGSSFPLNFQGKRTGKYPFAKVSDMNIPGNEKYLSGAVNYLDESDFVNLRAKPHPKGTVIFPKVGAALLTNKRRILNTEAIFDNNVMGLVPTSADSEFLYYWMSMLDFADYAGNGALPCINQSDVEKLPIITPPLPEQRKIAEILIATDGAIRKTEEVITKSEELKKGLMQELFTKGIGHTKFKKTKIGKIPEEWEVLSIKDAPFELIDGDRGTAYPKINDFSSGGYCLFLSNKNIKNDSFVFSEMQFISREKDEELRKGKLKRFDVVLTTRGSVGNVAFYDTSISFENMRINSGMLILRSFDGIDPAYLYHLMKSSFLKKRYIDLASGSAQPQLPIGSLEQIYIPIPPEDEQKEIVGIAETLDKKISANKRLLAKQLELKRGLMQDLLSGNVRTK